MNKVYMNLEILDKILKNIFSDYIDYKDDIYKIIDLYDIKDSYNEYDDVLYSYVSKEECINLVKVFIESVNKVYIKKFNNVILTMLSKDDAVKLLNSNKLNKDSINRIKRILNNKGIIYMVNDKCYIDILSNNDIRDSFILIHEFIHYVSLQEGALAETQAILSELMFSNYLLENNIINYKEINKFWNERISSLAPNNYFYELYLTLKLIDIYRTDKEILNGISYSKVIDNYRKTSNILRFVNDMRYFDLERVLGFF